MGEDTKKIEVKGNREYCDDRYVSWKWAIAAISGTIILAATLAWGLGQWGAKVDSKIESFDSFKIEYQTEIHSLHQTVHENKSNLDTIKTLLRSRQ